MTTITARVISLNTSSRFGFVINKKYKMKKVVFDIETVRRYETWEECPEIFRDAWEYVAKSKFPDMEPKASYLEKAGLFPEFGMIVAISAMTSGSEVVSFWGDEQELLFDFSEYLGMTGSVKLIGHNVKGFDIPYVVTRLMHHGLSLPTCLQLYGRKPWEMDILDTMDAWKLGFYRTSQAASLISVCLALGIKSPKSDISGADVGDAFYRGEINRIVKYCEADVRATGQVVNRLVELKAIRL